MKQNRIILFTLLSAWITLVVCDGAARILEGAALNKRARPVHGFLRSLRGTALLVLAVCNAVGAAVLLMKKK